MTLWTPTIEDSGVARYIALADQIETAIQSGELSTGDKLPTHRKLADTLEVTVGTVTRGYSEAERRGLVSAIVGSGTFVSSQKQPDIQFSHLRPSASNEIDMSLNLPISNQSAPGIGLVMQEIAADQNLFTELMGYQQERGLRRHRLWAAEWLASQGIRCNSDNLAITCGGQHAITLSLMAATRAGDTIAAEGLTYPGLKAVANQQGLKVIGLPMDEQGVTPDAFASYCKLNHLRAIYLCPSIQNPTNASMGLARRKAIIEIATANDVWIIEDEIPTNYLAQNPDSFVNLAPQQTFYINSHSKTVAPGLRVGYLISPPKLTESVATSIRAQCWFAPTLNVEIAQRWLDKKEAKDWLNVQKKGLYKRQSLATEMLDGYDTVMTKGSFHVWLSLPEPWRAMEFQSQLAEKGVRVLSAESFAVGRFPAPQAIRICISGPSTIDQLQTGLEVIRQQLEDGYDARFSVF
jgi:DNA-binding transcriptional MocR family regulator